jgi:hypothetical protein
MVKSVLTKLRGHTHFLHALLSISATAQVRLSNQRLPLERRNPFDQ